MKNIEHQRHTLSHLLAKAILNLYPDTLPTLGPAIDNGFYYDFEFKIPFKEEDLEKVEKEMKNIIPSWKEFSHKEVNPEEAKKYFENNPYKLELIDEIVSKGEKITLYTVGSGKTEFTDLCRGGHLNNISDIDLESFKLLKTAGAYWRGDEKNKMLTRIYGLAFDTKEELEKYEKQVEEAKKRDHKILGKELDLFTFSDLVGSGLPLWTPKGALLRNLLDDFVWSLRQKYGYMKVEIPHITKKDLYITSGHWDKFKDELFKITTREGHEFAMKPMNCPHHTQIYARKQWSYKELPQRYANSTACYRDEQSGELSGLSRVRSFTQDDAHVFCRSSQVKEEFSKIWNIVHEFYGTFGFKLKIRLSLHNPEEPEKYLGDPKRWQEAENILREVAKEKDAETFDGIGEAAFYGPKLDFMAEDSIGRSWQVATIQLDMNMPERFDLYCINENGQKERIVMIHAAIMGSIERFMSILIEHSGGNFPLWLSPVQVKILTVRENHSEYARKIFELLLENNIRVEFDDREENLGKKVRSVKEEKVPYWIVVGDKDIKENKMTLESRDFGQLGQITFDELIDKFKKSIKEKRG